MPSSQWSLNSLCIYVYLYIYKNNQNALFSCVLLVFPLFQVAGRYRVMVESLMASTDDIIFNCGDVIQLLHEELSGIW